MVLSVFAGTVTVAGAATDDGGPMQVADGQIDANSTKPLTISWFRDDGDANGPYPVLPNEYEDDTSGIQLFTNAEGDAQLRVDNSTTQNPNGQWDMLALHTEVSADALQALNPPEEGAEKGLVTQQFLENDDWNVEISQTNGDKVLNVADNQNGYENPPGVEADVPPVMVFADTEEIDSDFTVGEDPDTGLFVWIDPNRAVLTENGEEVSFEPGDEFEATFDIGGQTGSTTFEMVEGAVELGDDLQPANTVGEGVSARSSMAGGSELQFVLETADGETQTETVEVEGDQVLMDSDSAGTIPRGFANATFDFSGMENTEFTIDVYAPGPEGGVVDGEPARDDDDYFTEENRIQIASGSGTVQDVVDPNYTIEETYASNGKPLSVGYGVSEVEYGQESAAGIGGLVGDGELGYDESVALDVQGTNAWDGVFLHYETSDAIFEAIDRSPGENLHEKVRSSPLSFEVVQTGADNPKRLNMSRNTNGTHIIPDPGMSDERLYNGDDTNGIFLWLDFNEVTVYQDGQPAEVQPGETYEGTLTIETAQGTVEETIEFETIEGRTFFDNKNEEGVVEVSQSENAEIRLVTQLAAGFEWTIEAANEDAGLDIQSEGNENVGDGEILAGKIAGSRPNSTTSTSIDTSELKPGTELTLRAIIQEDSPNAPINVTEATAEILRRPSATLSFSDQSGDGETVVFEEVNLSDGGFVSLHTGGTTGPIIGTTEYLEAGASADVEVGLDSPIEEGTTVYAIPHKDTNDNQQFDFPTADEPYTSGGAPATASAEYSLETAEPTETVTATETATETQTETATETESSETDEPATETTTGSGPGFTVVAAVIALLAAAVIAVRRQ